MTLLRNVNFCTQLLLTSFHYGETRFKSQKGRLPQNESLTLHLKTKRDKIRISFLVVKNTIYRNVLKRNDVIHVIWNGISQSYVLFVPLPVYLTIIAIKYHATGAKSVTNLKPCTYNSQSGRWPSLWNPMRWRQRCHNITQLKLHPQFLHKLNFWRKQTSSS